MTARGRRVRVLGGAAILAVLVWRLGTGPFLDGIRMIDGWSLAAAAGISVLTTVCCAWRWSLIAGRLGVGVPLGTAVAACYRSQLLNTTLPGGVLGDVHRAVHHGRDVGDVGRSLRAVAWERSAGQVVQVVLALVVLVLLPSPVRSFVPWVAGAVVAGALAAVLLGRALSHGGRSVVARVVRTAAADLRDGLLARRAWPGIAVSSAVVVAGLVATFLIAARTAGTTASALQLLPLALLVLLAAGVPMNIAGWGPREGVAAWAFHAAGLSAAQGVATAVVFGVMLLVASLPGAVVLIAAWFHRGTAGPPSVPIRARRRSTPRAAWRVWRVAERPYTLLSCGMSIDGYLDSTAETRLVLSNAADLDRVDAVRAGCDAILVGAATVRNDNPRLLVRAQTRQDERVTRGLPRSPMKVTVTGRAQLDACAEFFATGDSEKLVYCASAAVPEARPARARGDRCRRRPAGGHAADDRGPLRPRGEAADGRGRRDGAHAVPDRRPCRRAAPGRRTVLRRRLPGAAVRWRRPVPVEPRSARDARRGAPDRRRRAAAVRPLLAVPHDDTDGPGLDADSTERADAATPALRDDPDPADRAVAVRRRVRHARSGVHLRRAGRRRRAPGPRARRASRRAQRRSTPGGATARPAAQRVPDR